MKNTNEQNVKRAYRPAEIQFFQTYGIDIINTSDPTSPFYGEDDPMRMQIPQDNSEMNA